MFPRTSPILRPPVLAALGAVAVILLVYRFANYREEGLVKKFVSELSSGNFQQAYQTWGPSSGYDYRDFMGDWGGRGYYGKIRDFKILGSQNRGTGVVVTVEFSHLKRPISLWVERKTQTISFSPFEEVR